jgi:hypothetical protein
MRPDHLPRVDLFDGDVARPWDALEPDVAAACAEGPREILVGGGEPMASTSLLRVLDAIKANDRRPIVLTSGRGLTSARLDRLVVHGLHELGLRPGEKGREASRLARARRLPYSVVAVLTPDLDDAVVSFAAEVGAPLRLLRSEHATRPRPPKRLDDAHAAALNRLWKQARDYAVPIVPDDLGRVPDEVRGEPVKLIRADLELLARGVVPEPMTAGVLVGQDAALIAESFTLSAWGLPPRDLPRRLGGTGEIASLAELPPGDPPTWAALPASPKVHIVLPKVQDELFIVSTMPALAAALQARGAEVVMHNIYDVVFHPTELDPPRDIPEWKRLGWLAWRTLTKRPTPIDHYEPPEDKLGHPSWWEESASRAAGIDEAFLARLDLSNADAIVVPGFATADRLLGDGKVRPGARLIVADFHMLDGAAPLSARLTPDGERASAGTWWPGDNVHVHACFGRYARLYRAHGVPLRQVHWRPYPLFAGQFAAPEPVERCTYAFSGGHHFRDWATLSEAAAASPLQHPIRVHASEHPELRASASLELSGTTTLSGFVETLLGSRYVVLPLHHDIDTAAGLTVLSMAQAAGKPVIASLTGASRDHIRHGVDGLLVPPDDPASLAAAIQRLDTDVAFLTTLAEGARAAGERVSVARWADEILDGVAPR